MKLGLVGPIFMLAGCAWIAPPRAPSTDEFRERNRRVLECLGDERSPRRPNAPAVRVGNANHAGDMRTYIVVRCDWAGLEHELVHYYRQSRAHDAISETCGDELSRQWRRAHPEKECGK